MPRAVSAIAVVSIFLAACGKDGPPPPPTAAAAAPPVRNVAATVNGRAISEAEVALRLRDRSGSAPPTRDEALEQLITHELQAQAAERAGLDKEPSFLAEMEAIEASGRVARRQKLARAYRLSTMAGAAAIPEQQARAYFDANQERLRAELEINRIVTRTRAEAEKAREALKQGTAFDEVAAMFPGEAKGPERLGFDTLPEDWWKPVSALAPGGHTEILPVEGGRFAIVQLVARRELPPPAFEDVRRRIEAVMTARSLDERRRAQDAELRKTATIEKKTPAASPAAPGPSDGN